MTLPVATGRNPSLCNPLEPDALGHEKAPQDHLRRYHEMERAKRLELLRSLLQSRLGEKTYNSLIQAGAQGDAHAEKAPELDPNLEAWVTEMEEVIAAWPRTEPAMRTGLMAIVRSRQGSAVRVCG